MQDRYRKRTVNRDKDCSISERNEYICPMLPCTANARIEPLARVCAVGPGCKQAKKRNKENPNRRKEFQGNRRYNSARMLRG